MTRTTPQLRHVADGLLTIERDEADEADEADAQGAAAARVCVRLQAALAKLLGAAGFSALMSRALTLAQAEARDLRRVQLKEDGSLDGLVGVQQRGEVVLVAHILGLLITFVGAALTTRILQDVWPTAAIEELDQGRDR
jgi:hypothetical protein